MKSKIKKFNKNELEKINMLFGGGPSTILTPVITTSQSDCSDTGHYDGEEYDSTVPPPLN